MENKSSTAIDPLLEKCNFPQCFTKPEFMCEVCTDGYCSIRCQSLDWHRHKAICKPMPQLLVLRKNPLSHSQNIMPTGNEQPSNAQNELAATKSDDHEKNDGAGQFQEATTTPGKPPLKAAIPVSSLPLMVSSGDCQCLDRNHHEDICKPMPTLYALPANPISCSQLMDLQNAIRSANSVKVNTEEAEKNEALPSNAQEELAAIKSHDHEKNEGKPPSIDTQSVVAAPRSFGIGDKHGGAVVTRGMSPLKAAMLFIGKEAAQTQGKGSSITAMLPMDVENEEAAQTQEQSLSKVAKPAELQENSADEASTTIKTEPIDVAMKSIEKPLTIIEEWKFFCETEFQKFLTFRVQHVIKNDPLIIWIIDERYLQDLQELEDHIHTHVQENFNRVPKESIAEGMLLFALIDFAKLYRVKVIQYSVKQENFLVHAIDYGKTFIVDGSNLFEASAKAAGMKALAFPVEIHGRTYDDLIQPEAKIHLRLYKAAGFGEFIKAQIQCESNQKVVQFLSLNDKEIKILNISDDGQSALVQSPNKFNAITEDLTKIMESEQLKTFTLTEETFLVAAHTVNGWHRAVLIDSLPDNDFHLIYLIDEGCVRVSDTIEYLPDKLAQIPACAFAITGKEIKLDLEKFEINNRLAKFQLLYELDKKLVLYCDSSRIGEIDLTLYFDDTEFCHKLANKEINESGTHVYITKFINHGQVYINLADSHHYPGLFGLLLPKCSNYMEERPTIQDIVLVKANEEIYYRGEIIHQSSDNEDIFDVLNVDTGNLHEAVHVNTMLKVCKFLRYLPRHLQELNLHMLHTLPAEEFPTTSAIFERINEYIQEKTLFQIEYPGKSFTEGNLLYLDGEGINLSMELFPLLNVKEESTSSPSPDVDQPNDDTLTNDNRILTNAIAANDDRKQKLILSPSPLDSPQPVIKKSDKENLMKHVTMQQTFQHFTLQSVTVKGLPVGQNIEIIMLDDSNLNLFGYISCTYFANQAEKNVFCTNLNRVHAYGQRTQKEIKEDYYTIGINEICVAMLKEDKRWYRAHCMSDDGNGMITIMFLDVGYIQTMNKREVLPIAKDLLYPIYANVCYMDITYEDNEPNTQFDNYILQKYKRLNCRQIIGENGYFIAKLN